VLTRVNCSLPFPIASEISLQEYNTFVENEDISGYKLEYKKGTVYIVEMASPEHEAVVELVGNYFRAISFTVNATGATFNAPGALNAPIQVLGQPSKGICSSLLLLFFLIFIISFPKFMMHRMDPAKHRILPSIHIVLSFQVLLSRTLDHHQAIQVYFLICHVFFVILL
jgi:hypothetical protein